MKKVNWETFGSFNQRDYVFNGINMLFTGWHIRGDMYFYRGKEINKYLLREEGSYEGYQSRDDLIKLIINTPTILYM
jgi:hypothetical protein